MASERQERANERARDLGYRNDYERRHWNAPSSEYFAHRAENYAKIHDQSYESVALDKNSAFWVGWRQSAQSGAKISGEGKAYGTGEALAYNSPFGKWLIDAGYREREETADIGETGEANA